MTPQDAADFPSPTQAAADAARLRRRALGSIAAAAAIVALVVVIRGTAASSGLRDAAGPEGGILSYLHRTDDGRKEIRSSAVLAAPPERVWSVVTDYDRFPDIFASPLWTMQVTTAERSPAGAHLVGHLASRLGDFPVDVRVHHDERGGERIASWDESTPDGGVNRGRWIVRGRPDGSTLLIYSLEVKRKPYPSFLINNVLLSEADTAVDAVRKRLAAPPPR
jgi:uncharacterized protein YndB with AHSA1/START domain